MFAIYIKELNTYLNSLLGMLVLALFLLFSGLFIWVFPQTSILNTGYAGMEPFFSISPYLLMFFIPAITMRMMADEKKGGTLELLMTFPVTNWDVVIAKYLGGFTLLLIGLVPTICYYISLWFLGVPQGNIDTAAVIGSYAGLVCLGSVFVAIGIFASSVTDNQVVAFLLALFVCYFLYDGLTALAAINSWSSLSYWFTKLSLSSQYESLGRGVIDSRVIIYYFSLTVGVQFLTYQLLSLKKA